MTEKITCEEFSDKLDDFATGKTGPEETAEMEAHLGSCRSCAGVYEMKAALTADPQDVPADVERELVGAIISDVAAAREAGRTRKSWAQRYLIPSMAAALLIFVFSTGFLLGEIRSLHREAGELREEVSAIETILTHNRSTATGGRGSGPVFGRLAGGPASPGRMTVGEAARILESLPENTPVLTEEEAERLIAGDRRLRRLAGRLEERPWKGGLTSGEILLFIITLDIDPDTRIPEELTIGRDDI